MESGPTIPPVKCWPISPLVPAEPEPVEEIKKSMFCGTVMSNGTKLPDLKRYSSWDDLIQETKTMLYGAADHSSNMPNVTLTQRGTFCKELNQSVSLRS